MATPRNDTYSVASGADLYAGRDRPLPAWLSGVAVNEWVEITGTTGAGGAAANAYSGFCVTPEGKVIFAAAGGHLDSDSNIVTACDLSLDAPSWTTLEAASSSTQQDVAYYADGKPASRHIYQTIQYVPALGRVFLTGARFTYGSGVMQYPDVTAYNVAGSAWSVDNDYADVPVGGDYGQVFDGSAIWTNGLRKYVPSTNTWSAPISSRAAATARYPWAFDSSRSQLFGLCYNDGEGFGSAGGVASKVPIGGTTETAVTFNSSSAYTAWQALAPEYAAMDYDADNDRFLFYDGRSAGSGVVYVITPNSGTTWDMSTLTTTGSAPGYTGTSGIVGKFKYMPLLGGFVALPTASSNLFFLRTA
jgi:hypothetical protein